MLNRKTVKAVTMVSGLTGLLMAAGAWRSFR